MKEKIMLFIIGVLVGGALATGVFYIYSNTNNNEANNVPQMNGNQPPEMPDGEMSEMPNGNPPEKPNEDNQSTNN